MKDETIRLLSILMITLLVLFIVVILIYSWGGVRDGPAILPDKMEVSIIKSSDGYIITIDDLGDFENLSITRHLYWQIWDSKGRVNISSGILSNIPDTVRLYESQHDGFINIDEKRIINNPSHTYGSYYFILREQGDQFYIIHKQIPT
jgi:uncharacterized protein affecting Mg2+/Co2+ transport